MSASPARIGAAISATSPGSYWLSAWTITTTVGAVAQRAHVAGLLDGAVAAVGRVARARRGRGAARPSGRRRRRRVVDQQRAVGGARPASRRPRPGSCAAARYAGRTTCTGARPSPLLRAAARRGSDRRAVGEDHALVAEREAERCIGGSRSATAVSGPLSGPSRSAEPADPAPRRERAHERHVVGDHEPARGDQLAQRPARQQARCGRAGSPTSARRRARAVGRRRVGRDDAQHAAGPQQPRAARRSRRPDRRGARARRRARSTSNSPGESPLRPSPKASSGSSRDVEARARRARAAPPSRESSSPTRLVAARARLVEQQAVAAADVEQPPARARARRSGRAGGSRSRAGRPPRSRYVVVAHLAVEVVQRLAGRAGPAAGRCRTRGSASRSPWPPTACADGDSAAAVTAAPLPRTRSSSSPEQIRHSAMRRRHASNRTHAGGEVPTAARPLSALRERQQRAPRRAGARRAGRPAAARRGENPAGTDAAGWPVEFQSTPNGTQLLSHCHVAIAPRPSITCAGDGGRGHASASAARRTRPTAGRRARAIRCSASQQPLDEPVADQRAGPARSRACGARAAAGARSRRTMSRIPRNISATITGMSRARRSGSRSTTVVAEVAAAARRCRAAPCASRRRACRRVSGGNASE